MSVIFAARGISKRFGTVTVLDDVDFEVLDGHINGLVGANGAGKSTLLKIIVGALKPDAGILELDGRPVVHTTVLDAAAAGIAIVSQELSLFPALSIEENLLLAPGGNSWQQRGSFRESAVEMLARLGVNHPLHHRVEKLTLADRQLVEIARALLLQPRLLILDEPTSSLHAKEVARLHTILRTLRDSGIGIIYVSHFLEELLDVADSVTVLRGGRRVPADIPAESGSLDAVVAAMLGPDADRAKGAAKPLADAETKKAKADPAIGALRISGLAGPAGLTIDSLEVPPGQITGLAGLQGSGFEELFRILFGQGRTTSGVVVLPSGAGLPASSAEAVASGVAYTPADRKQLGLMLRQTIAENIVSIRTLSLKRDGVVLNRTAMRDIAREQCTRLGVVAASVDQPVGELSGGNQQKVVFAKWIEARPSLLLLDDPTRGVDIGARAEMHRLMRSLAESGMVVVFYSSDPGEIAAVADRVLVFVDGRIQRDLVGSAITEHDLVSAMNTGVASAAKFA